MIVLQKKTSLLAFFTFHPQQFSYKTIVVGTLILLLHLHPSLPSNHLSHSHYSVSTFCILPIEHTCSLEALLHQNPHLVSMISLTIKCDISILSESSINLIMKMMVNVLQYTFIKQHTNT